MKDNYNSCVEGCSLPSSPNDLKILLNQLKREVKELATTHEKDFLKHDGKIAEMCKYIKDNLSNSIRCLLDSMQLSGELDKIISEVVLNSMNENKINVEVFGAVGDGIHDDTKAIENALAYCKELNFILTSRGKKYRITKDLIINSCNVDFNGGIIISNSKKITVTNENHAWNYNGHDIHFFKNVKLQDTNVIGESPAVVIENLEFIDWHDVALTINQVLYVDNIVYDNNRADKNTVSLEVNVSDKQISRLHGKGGFTGIVVNAQNTVIKDSQLWLHNKNKVNGTLNDSKFIHVKGGTGIIIDNCVSDTYQYSMFFEQDFINGIVNNFQVINNNVLYNNCDMYLINKYEPLIGSVLIRMTNMEKDNIKFHIGSPCKLKLRYFDGTPEDRTILYNGNIKELITDENGNSLSDKVEIGAGSIIRIDEGKLYASIKINFPETCTKTVLIDTSGMAGIERIHGESLIPMNSLYNNQDVIHGIGNVTKWGDNRFAISNWESGWIKSVAFTLEFDLD